MKKKKITTNYNHSYLYEWHVTMADNFQRLANQCEGRGFPESRVYFDDRAEDHRKRIK